MSYLNRIIVIASIFLVSCTYRTPVGPVHISSKDYFCRGTWHHPQNYYEYDEVGKASWYGDDFHGKTKATGEPFNKMAMTAAHKTLPIPSVVKVTSLKTGKSVIVVVDDRGPFVYKGRIIDLSYGAAKELGIHRYAPSSVRIQTLVEDSLKLSRYIANHCKNRRDAFGRSWAELYFREIRGEKSYFEPAIKSSRICRNSPPPTNPKKATSFLNHKKTSKKTALKKTTTSSKRAVEKRRKKRYNSLGSYVR